MMNMAERWLQPSGRVSPEEYRQLYRRAAKLHHRDKGGSDESMRFLEDCAVLLCGAERCRRPEQLDQFAKEKKKTYISKMRDVRERCKKRSIKKGTDAGAECYQEEVEILNQDMLYSSQSKARTDTRNPQNHSKSNAYRGHEEELLVFLDDSMSLKGPKRDKARKVLELLFPRFEKTPTAVHLMGGTARSVQSSVFKERVESNGGLYDNTAIRATLIWNNCNDVDLHIREPDGTEIFYGHKRSEGSFGYLDIDRNVGSSCDARPVENIRWEIGRSAPAFGEYEVMVNLYSYDGRAPHHTPFQLEVQHGSELKHFQAEVSQKGEKKLIHKFEFRQESSRLSRELFSKSMGFTLDDVISLWKCDAWTTYMWEYIYKTLLSASESSSATTWDVIIVTDGADNDSPDAFNGPSGFNEMMNQLHERGLRPRVSVYCIGSEHCTGDANGRHFYRDLVLASGGVYIADLSDDADDARPAQAFAVQLTGSVEERQETEHKSQEEWLQLMHSGAPVVNQNEKYTQELVLRGPRELHKPSSSKSEKAQLKCKQHGNNVQTCSIE
eukprot:Skav230782  [mRNA]  locus=scaffold1473:234833:236494:- [translate_table: standard]